MNEENNPLIEAFLEGRNICLTGGAGTGKSYNLKKLIEYCEENGIEIARAAMTGMASLQLPGGETVHSCFKCGLNSHKGQLVNVVTSFMFQKETQFYLKVAQAFIIDEMSMMNASFLELLDAIMKYVMGNDEPFGGKQLILSGDFMQLPPVDKEGNFKWAFESPVWHELNMKVVYLTEIKRQDDLNFSNALNMVRAGVVNDQVNQYFFAAHKTQFPRGVEPVKLLSTNKEVDAVNNLRLSQIQEPEENYPALIWAKDDYNRKKIIQDVNAVEHLKLKRGCQVMILRNNKGLYVNGSMGTYLGRVKIKNEENDEEFIDALRIELLDSKSIVTVPINEWLMEKRKEGVSERLATFIQFPVKLGYAITIHKSQGMSIDFLEVNLGKCFADGMAYVALSRARKYEGLRVLNWSARAVKANARAFNFYMGLKSQGVI